MLGMRRAMPWLAAAAAALCCAGVARTATAFVVAPSQLPQRQQAVQHRHDTLAALQHEERQWRRQCGARQAVVSPLMMANKEKEADGGGALKAAEFERQELKVIFQTMEDNSIHFQQLGPEQTAQVQMYVDKLLAGGSPMTPKAVMAGDALVGMWRLEFSSEEKYKILPPGSDVYTYVYDPRGGRLDTVLMFPRSPIVRSIQVICDYTMNAAGVLDFVFKKTLVDLFGFTLPVPTFGTPNAFLEMQYFDGELWMEQFDEPVQGGGVKKSVNVYRKVGTLTEADKSAVIKAQSKSDMRMRR